MARPVYDDVVVQRELNFPEIVKQVLYVPQYQGKVTDEKQVFKLDNVPMKGASLCKNILVLYDYFKLEAPEGAQVGINFNDQRFIDVDIRLVRLLKVLISSQVSKSLKYSEVVSDFTRAIISTIIRGEEISLPLTNYSSDDELQKILYNEINDMIQYIFDREGIPYTSAIESKCKEVKEKKKKEKKKEGKMSALKQAAGMED